MDPIIPFTWWEVREKVYGPIGRLFPLAVRWSKIGDFLPNFDRLDEEKATSSDWAKRNFSFNLGVEGIMVVKNGQKFKTEIVTFMALHAYLKFVIFYTHTF